MFQRPKFFKAGPFRLLLLFLLLSGGWTRTWAYQDPLSGTVPLPPATWTFSGETDVSWLTDRAIQFTGSEATFLTRLRLEGDVRLEEHILVRASMMWEQPIGEYSRLYQKLYTPNLLPEDLFLQADNMVPHDWLRFQAGIVKVPFSLFDVFALDDVDRPIILTETREWDSGVKILAGPEWLHLDAAVVNGEGSQNGLGRDTDSEKSLCGRLSSRGENWSFLKALEVGVSGYKGTKFSTPIKELNNHFGADASFQWSWGKLIGGYTGFQGKPVNTTILTPGELQTLGYQSGLTYNNTPYDRSGWYAQVEVEPLPRLTLTALYSQFNPHLGVKALPADKVKNRAIFGARYQLFKHLQGLAFFTWDRDPYLQSGPLETNPHAGSDKAQVGVRADF